MAPTEAETTDQEMTTAVVETTNTVTETTDQELTTTEAEMTTTVMETTIRS